MALAHDLLSQARVLASIDVRRPKQANLRRAVSTAYYALFHLLLASCFQRLAPSIPPALGPRIARTLAHAEMRDVCLAVSRNNPGTILQELVPAGFSTELRGVAKTFVDLQEARHLADYDLTSVRNRSDAVEFVNLADRAFEDWKSIQNTEEANVFLSALLFARRWSK